MNACVRAVVRTGLYNGCEVIGIQHGYEGMIEGNFVDLGARSSRTSFSAEGRSSATARSEPFRTAEGRARAAAQLNKAGIEGLVAIGGDGTFQGVVALIEEHGVAAIGVPGTIDNDLFGTDFTIGYDTAVNTAMEAIDKIRDTAASHDRLFYVEVMGKDAGFIALDVGISSGAEVRCDPRDQDECRSIEGYLENYKKVKSSAIIIVAEGRKRGARSASRKKSRTPPDTITGSAYSAIFSGGGARARGTGYSPAEWVWRPLMRSWKGNRT